MDKLPTRKKNRLKEYDYSQNGAYFITICAKDRAEIFSTIESAAETQSRPHIHLSKIGQFIENEIAVLSETYPGVSVEHYVIMPNHVHMIIRINRFDNENCGRQDAAPTIPRMINQWKRAISKQAGYSIWQKSFHDHVIRNQDDYNDIAEYIENNPARWEEDCFYQNNE